MRIVILLVALSLTVFGQRHKLEELDTEKPEGKLLHQLIEEAILPRNLR